MTQLTDFKNYCNNDQAFLKMLKALEVIYYNFRNQEKPLEITCFDSAYYDENKILKILSFDVREIPNDLIEELEFYGEGEDWGTTLEVKYFLPRLIEYNAYKFLSECFKKEDYIHIQDKGFFKYKLSQMINWPDDQKTIILEFIYNFFEILVNNCENLSDFIIDYCQYLPLDEKRFIKIWDNASHIRKEQHFRNLLDNSWNNVSQKFAVIYIGNLNIIEWIIHDEHIKDYKFFFEDKYYNMLLNKS